MIILNLLIAVVALVCLVHGLFGLPYALSAKWKPGQRLKRYL